MRSRAPLTLGFHEELALTRLGGVRVLRRSVWPAGAAGAPSTPGLDPECALEWTPATRARLPVDLELERETESRWVLRFPLPNRMRCHGLGERYGGLELRGKVHTLITCDDPHHSESTDSMYQVIPVLYLVDGRQARAIWVDSLAPMRWSLGVDLGSTAEVELLSRRGFSVYLFGPGSLPDLVRCFTTLTGRAGLPPRWSLGHQQSRWSYPTRERVLEVADELRRRRLPTDTVVLDIDYMDDYRVFTVSPERFPDFPGLVRELREKHLRVVAIVDPGVQAEEDFAVFRRGRDQGVFCRTRAGELFIGRAWAGESAFPDFLRPEVRRWWQTELGFYLEQGVAGLWNDMNEPSLAGQQRPLHPPARELPRPDEQLFVQASPEGLAGHLEVRSGYGLAMARAAFEALREARPDERPFVLTRSAYAGAQRYSAVWLGDNQSWFEHLRMSIPMLLNLGLSGLTFAGADVGGFLGDADGELVVRWYQTGIFYPFFRNHCARGQRDQEPWSFGTRVETILRKLLGVRYRLLPYLESLFYEHRATGAPIMRPLGWHFPDDEECALVDDEFLWGEQILVAPVLARGRCRRAVYLPAGRWFPFEGGEPLIGQRWHSVVWPLAAVPAFVKEGAILPLFDALEHTDQAPRSNVTFRCFGRRGRGVYFEDDGLSLGYRRGEFGEYQLSYQGGRFRVAARHAGFRPGRRRYYYEAEGRRHRLRFSES